MFSVKVAETRNQAEVVFEASQVKKYLFDDRKPGDQFIGDVICETESGMITYQIRASAPNDGSDDQTMYVMNRFGATVATYHL